MNRQTMSVMTLAEPVYFGHAENDPVSIVFCLAATSQPLAHGCLSRNRLSRSRRTRNGSRG